ncbi:MAG: DUF2786 domain-containing protein [Acidimicrobiales bacterium]|nr:DUF2786 domain-containing protein [Acidimicrobiales bacterium]
MSPVIDRVRALLAKAESTTYPAEADALLAKAQELITRHAIDAALLGPNAYDEVGHEEIALHGSYSAERAQLWNAVAAANRCLVLMLHEYGRRSVREITLIGAAEDRELVKLLAVSLEAQALTRLPDPLDPSAWSTPSDTVRLRRSYLLGFAQQVRHRLRETAEATRSAAAEHRGLPMLVEADEGVHRYAREHFHFSAAAASRTTLDPTGYVAGQRQGAAADLGARRIDTRLGLPELT